MDKRDQFMVFQEELEQGVEEEEAAVVEDKETGDTRDKFQGTQSQIIRGDL